MPRSILKKGILTVAVVTTPFRFEGMHRGRLAMEGVRLLEENTDTLIAIPNQNLFQLVDKKTSLVDAFSLADDVLLAGVKSVTDLMVNPGLINLDFADVRTVRVILALVPFTLFFFFSLRSCKAWAMP